jgi:hypothetical protein
MHLLNIILSLWSKKNKKLIAQDQDQDLLKRKERNINKKAIKKRDQMKRNQMKRKLI